MIMARDRQHQSLPWACWAVPSQEETRQDEETASVFKLAELAQPYKSRIKQLWVEVDKRVHFTRLNERLPVEFSDMWAYTKGEDALIAFEEDIASTLAKTGEQDSIEDVVHIAQAVQIVCHNIFGEAKPFKCFPKRYQKDCATAVAYAIEHGPRGTQINILKRLGSNNRRSNISSSTCNCSDAKIPWR